MSTMIYFSMMAIIAANGCDEDILLIPESMTGDVLSASYPLSNLLDGNYNTRWIGDSTSENVYYYFANKVVVKEVFVQRYGTNAQRFSVYDGYKTYMSYFETSTESYSTVTLPMNYVQTDYLKFWFYYPSKYPMISRAEVYGCYNTSTPTTVPTSVPTELPTLFPTISPTLPPVTTDPTKVPSTLPTISPTLPPVTTDPTKTPSTLPTTAPTKSPSGDSPSPQPSTAPSSSPTEPPSPIPSISPSSSPTVVFIDRGLQVTLGEIEFLVIVIVFLCGVILFGVRRYRVIQSALNSHKAQESEMYIVRTQEIEEESTRIAGKNLFDRKVDMCKTVYNEGENNNTEFGKVSNHQLGDEKNERTESHVVSDQREDLRFGLDQVKSEL